jgi:hypothetical protein
MPEQAGTARRSSRSGASLATQRKLAQSGTSQLEYFRLYDRTGQTETQGVWGRCAFPYPTRWAIGTDDLDWEWVWREATFRTREEAFVWIAGHHAVHWLRHSRQIPGRNYETQANRFGFAWLDEWRAPVGGEKAAARIP